jgi:hypothetical protein
MMKRINNHQVSLKPQDLLVALKLALPRQESASYAELAKALGLSASEVHASVGRLKAARLAVMKDDRPVVVRAALKEFVLHGARYAFPAIMGTATRGMPTGYAAAPLSAIISQPAELPPVWPDAQGTRRGIAFYPLYPTAPQAARNDNELYECLVLLDALRGGAARERQIATKLLDERLT